MDLRDWRNELIEKTYSARYTNGREFTRKFTERHRGFDIGRSLRIDGKKHRRRLRSAMSSTSK